ncbi:MAG: tetraacyldisaccharide 4'-kinase [Alteromonadaceae bacterium]|jgi:tetraacyldisaccharide 4'-kinase
MRLIEKVWFQRHPAKWLFVPLLMPLTLLFGVLTTLRRMFYKFGFFTSYRVNKPVVVVGNIGIGGNGKTPFVLYLIEQCIKQGIKPGVISRGYGGQAPHYPYLLDQTSTAVEAGDEPLLIYNRSAVPVVVGSDRIASAELLIEQGCDVIIADDGLQHYRLIRDIELIIIDGNRRFGNGLLLPAGPLREGLWRLKSVGYVINNSGLTPLKDEITMSLHPKVIVNLLTNEQVLLEVFRKKNPAVNAIAGIGDPQRFFNTLTTHQFSLAKTQGFIDHHNYQLADFNGYDEDMALLMTEKDGVKCQQFAKSHWWYVPVDAQFNEQQIQPLLADIMQLIKDKI